MDGGDLQQLFERRRFKPLSMPKSRRVIEQIGKALKYLHARNIIHRDIKLENVMVHISKETSADLNVKLVDFGLAEKVSQ